MVQFAFTMILGSELMIRRKSKIDHT